MWFLLKGAREIFDARVQASVDSGFGVLQGAQAQTYPWVELSCFVPKLGGREGKFCHFDYSFKSKIWCNVKKFFLWASPAKSMLWLIINTNTTSRARGSDWLVIGFMGGEGE